ncbi:Hypothetical protein CINCED_3A016685 [Cinara cedri]|uniref:Uncharacterized protein n=1 Tax=Cinara cedri TaxID=506608 RepID=A0A5E4MTS7_9HEMI|nr:Hypothetical protein CINCED_3A016685 [Cinara cedri]
MVRPNAFQTSILTCSEVESYDMFQELYSKANDMNLDFVENIPVQYIYKSSFSASLWYALWTMYRTPVDSRNLYDNRLSRNRRASFHGFGLHDSHSRDSVHSALTVISNSLSHDDYLNEPPNRSDYEFVDAVLQESASLDSLVNKNMVDWFVKEANSIDDDDSSSFSFDLAVRAENKGNSYNRFLKLTPEEIANASKLKPTEASHQIRQRFINLNALPRLPQLLTDNGRNNDDWTDEKSEIELKTVNIATWQKERNAQLALNELQPLTPEMLLGIFYKYHYYKPAAVV